MLSKSSLLNDVVRVSKSLISTSNDVAVQSTSAKLLGLLCSSAVSSSSDGHFSGTHYMLSSYFSAGTHLGIVGLVGC